MAAAPFDIFLVLSDDSGRIVQSEVGDASDVADAYVTWKSLGSETSFTARQDCWLADVKLTAAGTDTTRMALYINGVDKGITLLNAGIVATVNNRVPNPIGKIQAGSRIQLKQLA